MHEENLSKRAEAREAVVRSLSQSNLSLRDRAGVAMSPRTKEGHTAFGSTSSRPHLWLGATAAAGSTTDHAAPQSPRGSRRGSGVGLSSQAGDEPHVPESPGPGAYESGSGFKKDLRKDPSRGSSSAFKSKTKRLFTPEGGLHDGEIFPGRKVNDSPGVGTYVPKTWHPIGVAAAAVVRQAEKLQNLRRSSSVPSKEKSFENNVSQQHTPGPGAYEPGKVKEKKNLRVYAVSNSPFRSGSRRALPWGDKGNNAPSSTRARNRDVENTPYEEPGPGDYALPGTFDKAKEKPRRNMGAVGAWTKGAARFSPEPDVDKLTPSSVHYTPNYSHCSSSRGP